MTCAFCDATEDVVLCDFPVMDFVATTYAKLHAGDKVHRISEQVTRPAATVVEIEFPMLPNYLRGARIVLRKSNGQEIERVVYARSPVRVLKDKHCETPACWRHRCERGPGATCCASHWKILEV